MQLNRISERIEKNKAAGAGSLLPYLTSGFPSARVTAELIRRANALGVAAVEIGEPYSDSIADGPVIQQSFHAALEAGHTLDRTFELVSQVRPTVECALISMTSFSIVHRYGLDAFMGRACEAGFDGVILPDVPVEEAAPSCEAAERVGLCHIGLVAPTTSTQRREAIAKNSTGFVYQIATAGTTGERSDLSETIAQQVHAVRQFTSIPVCVGFGVSTAEHVRAVSRVADGAIVGSAIVRRMNDELRNGASEDSIVETVVRFLSELMSGTRP